MLSFNTSIKLLICIAASNLIIAQPKISSFPPIENFKENEQLTAEGIYCITQNEDGILYFGVDQGIMEYDGEQWSFIDVPGIVKGITYRDKTIYLGSGETFGYLEEGDRSRWKFKPLIDSLSAEEKGYGGTWFVESTSREIVFNALLKAYIYKDGAIDTFIPERSIIHNSVIQDTLYARISRKGLVKLNQDGFHLLSGGESIANNAIACIIPSVKNKPPSSETPWFIFHRNDTPSLYDGKEIKQAYFEQTQDLIEARPYKGVLLADGNLAVGTYLKGIYIYTSKGILLNHITRENGLIGNSVQAMFLDKNNDLWVGCRNGLSRLSYGSSKALFDYRNGFDGEAYDMLKFENTIYAANNKGVHFLSDHGKFQQVPYVSHLSFNLLNTNRHLLAATADGISWVNGPITKDHRLIISHYAFALASSKLNPHRVYYTTPEYIGTLRYFPETKVWKDEGSFTSTEDMGVKIHEHGGYLWAIVDSTLSKYKVDVKGEKVQFLNKTDYDKPTDSIGNIVTILEWENHFFVFGDRGIYEYNDISDRFEKSKIIPPIKNLQEHQSYISEIKKAGNYLYAWTKPHDYAFSLDLSEKKHQWRSLLHSNTALSTGHRLYIDTIEHSEKAYIWASTQDGLLRFLPHSSPEYSKDFKTILREIQFTSDSTKILKQNFSHEPLIISPETKSLGFTFTSPMKSSDKSILYQYKLDGFTDTWSKPQKKNSKEYTNLKPNKYVFRVRALNADGDISAEDHIKITVLNPWYTKWWALTTYVLIGALILLLIFKTWIWKLKKQQEKLEEIIQDRTEELRLQTIKLKESERIKSQFYTNISHEFRTPLTVISGMASQIRKKKLHELEKNISLIERNSNVLLHLINQILDLSKLDSGKQIYRPIQSDIIAYLDYIVESFRTLAEMKGILLEVDHENENIIMDYEKSRFLKIVTNLLSNAIKFTPEGGHVLVQSKMLPQSAINEEWNRNGFDLKKVDHYFAIDINDTGIGIPPEKQAYIFDQFYQVDNSNTRQGEGTGIGLSLVKEIVSFYGGIVQVRSIPDHGTKFSVLLPIYNEAELKSFNKPTTMNHLDVYDINHDIVNGKQEKSHSKNKPTLLIIEDNKDIISYLKSCLEKSYNIMIATNGNEGINTAIENIPDIIISDVMMPEKNGLEVCEFLKLDKRTSHIPIIILTAKSTFEDKISGYEVGADSYLNKPFNERELLVHIDKLIKLRKRLQERYVNIDVLPKSDEREYKLEDEFMAKVHEILIKNLDDDNFTIENLCLNVGLSRMQLHRKIKALTGFSTSIFIRKVKLHKALQLIKTTHFNISEIAYKVGYKDPKYFARIFSAEFGSSPSKVKENI